MKTYRSLHANNYGYSTALEIKVSITAKKSKNNIGQGLGYSTALKLKVSITATKNQKNLYKLAVLRYNVVSNYGFCTNNLTLQSKLLKK